MIVVRNYGKKRVEFTLDFTLDGFLKSNLDHVYQDVRFKDYDSFLVISGREGFGKSTLAGQVATYLDPTYNIERCTFTADQFVDACENAEKYQAVVFDETMGYLSSRGAMSSFNRRLIKVMSEMRSKNLFVVLCIPNFFELDRYPAMHRSTGLLHVNKRGEFGCYDYRKKKLLYLEGKKSYSYVIPPRFKGRFTKYFHLDKAEYEKKKQEGIKNWEKMSSQEMRWKNQRNILITHLMDNKIMKSSEIGALIDVSPSQNREIRLSNQ